MKQEKKAFTASQSRFMKRLALFLCLAHLGVCALIFLDMLFDPSDVLIHNAFYYVLMGITPLLLTVDVAAICAALVLRLKGCMIRLIWIEVAAASISTFIPTLLQYIDQLQVYTLDYILLISLWETLKAVFFTLLIVAIALQVSYLLLKKHGKEPYLEKFTFLWGIFMLADLLIFPVAEFISLCIEAGGILYANEILLFVFSLVLCVAYAFTCLYTFKKIYPKMEVALDA